MLRTNYRHSLREMFSNQPSQQSVRKTPTDKFCGDDFIVLVTSFGTTKFLLQPFQLL